MGRKRKSGYDANLRTYLRKVFTDADVMAEAPTAPVVNRAAGMSGGDGVILMKGALDAVAAVMALKNPEARKKLFDAAPTDDRRPALLVAALVAVFFAVLFVPVLYTYFGLTAGNSFVLGVVLVALVPWFAVLTAAYRLRLLDRLLGLQELPRARAPETATWCAWELGKRRRRSGSRPLSRR